jgi:hypothetical protein
LQKHCCTDLGIQSNYLHKWKDTRLSTINSFRKFWVR